MRIEIIALVIMSLLFLFAWLPVSVGKMEAFGKKWLASNRIPVKDKELPEWAARCERAHNNLKENMPPFVAGVLLLAVTSRFTQSTEIAAGLFVVGRIGHYISYGLGSVTFRASFYFLGLFSNIFLLVKVLF